MLRLYGASARAARARRTYDRIMEDTPLGSYADIGIDHAAGIAPGGRQAALAVLAGRFGARTAALVAAVTNQAWEPGRDKHEQYRPLVPALRGLILRPAPARGRRQGHHRRPARRRPGAARRIRHDHHGGVPLLPGPAPARNRGL